MVEQIKEKMSKFLNLCNEEKKQIGYVTDVKSKIVESDIRGPLVSTKFLKILENKNVLFKVSPKVYVYNPEKIDDINEVFEEFMRTYKKPKKTGIDKKLILEEITSVNKKLELLIDKLNEE